MTTITLRERTFTPCPEHVPAVDLDSEGPFRYGIAGHRFPTWRAALAASPSCRDCPSCSELTLATARDYARAHPAKREPLRLPWAWERAFSTSYKRSGTIYVRTPSHQTTTSRTMHDWWRAALNEWREAAVAWS